MKKYGRMIAAAFMMIIMALTPMAAWAGEAADGEPVLMEEETSVFSDGEIPAEDDLTEDDEIPMHLTAASATHLSGMFFENMWGRNTSDLDVQALLYGYDLVTWNGNDGMFEADPSVVSGITAMEYNNGDQSFLITLYNNLYYSDGTPITAWDYAFSWLLLCSNELAELGVKTADLSFLTGFDEYKNGTVPYLAGISVTADDTLVITIDHEALPYFYELGLLSCIPYPIHVIAPGVKVFDDGYGVYLANDPDWKDPDEEEEETTEEDTESAEEQGEDQEPDEDEEEEEEPRFTSELLAETILDPETGYLSYPSVVSGPYTLTSWDGEQAEFEVNPYYKGDLNGDLPLFDTLTYLCLENENMIENLDNRDVDLLNKVTNAETITAGIELTGKLDEHENPLYSMSNYPRTGLTYIWFSRTDAKVASKAVRQAIAWCMDREELMISYAGNFGVKVNGYYGIRQWMYSLALRNTEPPIEDPDENDPASVAKYEEELAAWEEVNLDDLTDYTLDKYKAELLLEEDGWKKNDDGIREKDGMLLELVLAYPEGNAMAEAWEEELIPVLKEIGIILTLRPMPMEELLAEYYEEPDTWITGTAAEKIEEELEETTPPDMFYLGSNFSLLFSPEEMFDDYAPDQMAEIDRNLHAEDYAETINLAIEDELRIVEYHLEDHAKEYVDEYIEMLLAEDEEESAEDEAVDSAESEEDAEDAESAEDDEPEISGTEQSILALTELAMDIITAEEEEETDAEASVTEAAEAEEEDAELSEEEIEELRKTLLQIYYDIYHYYEEQYRDYGSLYALSADMNCTEPGEILEYMQKWVLFQEKFNEVLPVIPIYSNVYFDFYTSELKEYYIASNVTWGNAILGAYYKLPEETEPETETETEEETSGADDQMTVEFGD